jgi:hypothetical protein
MTKRRPTAADRDIAEELLKLPLGYYLIEVYDYPRRISNRTYPGFYALKREGQRTLSFRGPTRIDIYAPIKES